MASCWHRSCPGVKLADRDFPARCQVTRNFRWKQSKRLKSLRFTERTGDDLRGLATNGLPSVLPGSSFDDIDTFNNRLPVETIQTHVVQWYPGHIARAERLLKEQLGMVDLVLEIRDARIPASTTHPSLEQWRCSKPRLLIINRVDSVSSQDKRRWQQHYEGEGQGVYWTNGRAGAGVDAVRRAAVGLSKEINRKRASRGLKPRPVRACVVGFPNIGKSALINRLLSRKVVESAPRPGVTRVLRWVRVGEDLDLLDAPGIIPSALHDQKAARHLAICNDIGEASYVDSLIAASFLLTVRDLPGSPAILKNLKDRYKMDPRSCSAEMYVYQLADQLFGGDVEKAGLRILTDYRAGRLGNFALELPGGVS